MMGASGVPIPAPQVYENIERNVVSGAAWTIDAYRTFRLNEVAPNITATRLIASPLAILMNRAAYDSLPEEDRAVFDAHTGRVLAEWIAERVDATEAAIETELRDAGEVTFVDLDEAGTAAWQAALSGAADAWLAGQQGDSAAAVLERAREVAAQE
jgi:TRAP-type C4-dicarboxylate transport system substrate-binding protein